MRRGENNPFFGKKHTAATKRKMSAITRMFNLNRTYSITKATIKIPRGMKRGYLAGLIDGEGSIRFHGIRKRRLPFVAIYNSDRSLKSWLEKETGIIARWTDFRGRRPGWTWRVQSAANVYRICDALFNLLVVKKKDAEKALAFLRNKYRDTIKVKARNG